MSADPRPSRFQQALVGNQPLVDDVLKITPLDNQEPDEAELLTRQAYAILPRIKITDLLVEVDE